jgi:predicted nucleic acid-binding protein
VAGLFVDTSGWAAFLVRSEPFHQRATVLIDQHRKSKSPILTTNYVLTELAALLTSPMRVERGYQIQIIGALRSADWIRTVHIDSELDAASWKLWSTHDDKTWSLVDCASFVVMKKHLIGTALTNDRHFEQAGFSRALRYL